MFLNHLNFLEKLYEAYYFRQINSFSKWLIDNSLDDQVVLIDLPHQERFLKDNFSKNKEKKISFIFCKPKGLQEALEKNNLSNKDSWEDIFLSEEFEIWENKEMYHGSSLPIRFGLNEDEKKEALGYVRKTLEVFLKTGNRKKVLPNNLSERFLEDVTVDVALWVNGELRGSRIVEKLHLLEAIEEASIRACRDERFKPLSFEELENTTIEIAILSSLRLPLRKKERVANDIYTEKGYAMSMKGRTGWFLPAVFNCLAFKGLNDFLINLIEKKIGFPRAYLSEALVEIFEVDNFIESTKRTSLTLRGPVVFGSNSVEGGEEKSLDYFYKCADKSADFLCRIQEKDGNITPVINPLTGTTTQIDWVRLALSAWALAGWGRAQENRVYEESAKRSFLYLKGNLYKHPYLSVYSRCLSFIYYRRLALILGETEEVQKSDKFIADTVLSLEYEPILYSQIACHLIDASNGKDELLMKAKEFTEIVLADYQKRIKENDLSLEIARYPELIYLLREIGERVGNTELIEKAEEIERWFISKQLSGGSFPNMVNTTFSYVRGTGKIFEVLCLNQYENADVIKKAMLWITEMQYTKDNTFFVKDNIKEQILGGFRHDNLNQEVWIDATAHVLIGATRLKNSRNLL